MSKPFQFKQFTVAQDLAAMKIGTDAVLLGAWTQIPEHTTNILDIGSGTGVLGLMMAQRSDAMTIDAVEIDDKAYMQSVANFEHSPWGDRLYCYHASFQEFVAELEEEGESYDLIISNPPYYESHYQTADPSRNQARFESALPFEELLRGVASLLSEDGCFSTIIPYEATKHFIELANQHDLKVSRHCEVRGNEKSNIKRSLLSFTFNAKEVEKTRLTIEKERNQYTEAYINLTKDFYLKM